jgi:hypothetical protein
MGLTAIRSSRAELGRVLAPGAGAMVAAGCVRRRKFMTDVTKHEMSPPSGVAGNGPSSLFARLARLRNRSMFILLLLLVATIFIVPAFLPEGPVFRVFADVMMTLILVSGVLAIVDHRKLAITLALIAVLVIVVRWAEWIVPARALLTFRHMSTLSACVVLASAVGINVFASGRSVGDRVFGAIVLYLLLGLIAAFAYSAIYALDSAAFSKLPSGNGSIDDWLYFSFVTLTTVGYGDITPIGRAARALAMLEGLVGQLYPAIIIARFVSLPSNSKG